MIPRDALAIQQNRVHFRLRLLSHWVDGEVATAHRRLIDLLNSDHAEILIAEGVSVQNCLSTGCGVTTVDCAIITTSAILFAVPTEESRDAPAPRDPMTWVKKRPERALIGIGPYQISGNIYLPEGSQLRTALVALPDRFFAVGKVVVSPADGQGLAEEHEVVFVNRERMESIAPAPGF